MGDPQGKNLAFRSDKALGIPGVRGYAVSPAVAFPKLGLWSSREARGMHSQHQWLIDATMLGPRWIAFSWCK